MTKEPIVGAHTSTSGGLHNALLEGKAIGAATIQLFTSNQRQWNQRELTPEIIDKWFATREETGLQKIMSHDSYLINLGAPNPEILEKSRIAFKTELKRCQALNISFLNFHPGSALKDPRSQCIDRIVESLLEVADLATQGETRLLIESTAGQGSNIGHRFEELAEIVHRVEKKLPIGICIDTCHTFAAGYDLRTKKDWDATLKEFDDVVGLQHLYAFHINDSKFGLGSRKDRHEHLGDGEIGMECFKVIMTHPKTRDIPKYLETPGGAPFWTNEIKMLKDFYAHKN